MAKKSNPISVDISAAGFGVNSLIAQHPYSMLSEYMKELRQVVEKRDWNHPACSLILPYESKFAKQSYELAKECEPASLIIVAGIGGSSLGAIAVSQAILGPYHNMLKTSRQIVFADTTDGALVDAIIKLAKLHIEKGGKVVLNAVSKTGTTLETAANFHILLEALQKAQKKGKRKKQLLKVVVTTDEGSILWKHAQKRKFACLAIPKNVGGRYCVFSPAALFPLALAGVNIKELVLGAKEMQKECLSFNLASSPAAQMAMLLHAHAQAGRRIHDHFLFSNSLFGIGQWYRQLLAESIGKEKNMEGRIVHEGITPTTSIGPTDLHSMAQLYLGGPNDKFFRIVTIDSPPKDLRIPPSKEIEELAPNASGKRLSQIMDAISGGLKAAYSSRSIPFVHVRMADLSERSVGALLQMEMIEVMLLAKLFGVNAFDQPAVEEYKKEAKKLLSENKTGIKE